jgi:hypothetical protein
VAYGGMADAMDSQSIFQKEERSTSLTNDLQKRKERFCPVMRWQQLFTTGEKPGERGYRYSKLLCFLYSRHKAAV